ncbi:MAG: flavodoxin [Halioglobus sp.]|nr:flavodoxin [Halioglobus sp.]
MVKSSTSPKQGKQVKTLLIVYHSQSGASARLAAAARKGAEREEEVQVVFRRAWDAGVRDLAAADGLLLVAAENSGHLSGGMKDFLDRVFYPAIDREVVIPYALLLSAGNDGRNAEREVRRILKGIPLVAAAQPLITRGVPTQEHLAAAGDVGQALAAGIQLGIF